MQTRSEKDNLGEAVLPADTLYGIHTWRALQNFPLSGRRVHPALIHAYGMVKLACARTNHDLDVWDEKAFSAISDACTQLIDGVLDEHIPVDALQGGAGTSLNMNVNEVLTNRALQILGYEPGQYEVLHPIEDLNLHQSTNDTFPTALKVAAILGLRHLETEIVCLLETFQQKEKDFAHIVKIGRTQMQDAVLTTMGRTMSAYAEAISRDRWRIYKCEERLRVVNLGGTAIGTGLSAPRDYIFRVVDVLKDISGIGLSRAENLVENTQNADVFVEVSGILKACASTLLKMAGDFRFMSSGPSAGIAELTLPKVQAGSSIMPGKVNPVIPEAVSQAAIKVIANDGIITQAVSMGNLELNAFMPLIADALLETLDLLANACSIFREHCLSGIIVNEEVCRQHVHDSTAVVTALVEHIGYERAEALALESADGGRSIKTLVLEKQWMSESEFEQAVSVESVLKLGHQVSPFKKECDA